MREYDGGRVVLLSKDNVFCRTAWAICRAAFGDSAEHHAGAVGDPMPDLMSGERPEWLLSFLSPWIVPKAVLDRAGASLNFHPGSAEYPGSGCYNFALYEGAREYGPVCHHMLARVDTGRIVQERLFPIAADETVESLKYRTLETMVEMFRDVVGRIVRGEQLPAAPRHWTRRPFLLREMEALRRIEPGMSADEVARRIRATTYPGFPGPFLDNGDGPTFFYPVPDRPARA